jgi:hypothetical protein
MSRRHLGTNNTCCEWKAFARNLDQYVTLGGKMNTQHRTPWCIPMVNTTETETCAVACGCGAAGGGLMSFRAQIAKTPRTLYHEETTLSATEPCAASINAPDRASWQSQNMTRVKAIMKVATRVPTPKTVGMRRVDKCRPAPSFCARRRCCRWKPWRGRAMRSGTWV